MRLLAATSNRFKLQELQSIASGFGIEVLSASEFQRELNLSPPPEVEESEVTYFGNASLKARAYARWGQCDAIADDSGLEVHALGGRPGVFSARYGGVHFTDEMRQEKLLAELNQLDRERIEQGESSVSRSACYRCALVIATWSAERAELTAGLFSAESSLDGEIVDAPRGRAQTPHGNFGYNPVVLIPSLGGTLSEISFDVICQKGFRAVAAKEVFDKYLKHSSG